MTTRWECGSGGGGWWGVENQVVESKKKKKKKKVQEDFPGGPMVKTLPSKTGSRSSIPGRRTKILYDLWPKSKT